MLLKFSQYQKRSKLGAASKPQRGFVTGSKKIAPSKGHRKGKGVGNKKVNGQRILGGRIPREEGPQTVPDPCDNSNDSGLGFDHQDSYHHHHQIQHQQTTFSSWGTSTSESLGSSGTPRSTVAGVKRRLLDIKIESDDANDNFTFPHVHQQNFLHQPPVQTVPVENKSSVVPSNRRVESGGKNRSIGKKVNSGANQNGIARSRDGQIVLEIVSQPETQHRARYQTEGSRGAVKDVSGNSFPLVKLSGYEGVETAVLQVYIGTDQGKVAPHMFYQACKVSGKNSTPCVEKKINGTVVIEIEFNPSKDMLVLCDCVGILKERNVDVEHRFPEENQTKSRKKSTRCRMVFRTTVTLHDGTVDTLQVTSHPIVCTQPPGVPEICKKSITSCPVTGGVELFIIGKNFLKDTRVRFYEGEPGSQDWDCYVQPDKEYLHQSHLVCTVPRYRQEDIKCPMAVNVSIVSGGKASEPVPFVYTPNGTLPCHSLRPSPSYGNY